MTRVRLSAVSALFLLTSFVIGSEVPRAAQRPQGGGGPAGPITVDFIAVGANGQPIADLQASDITVRIAGRNRTVSSLALKKIDAGGSAPAATIAPPFDVNAVASAGRAFMVVIDVESLRAGTERAIRDSLEQVFKGLGGADRVALSVAPKDTVGLGFGAGLGAVRDALGKMNGMRPASVSSTDTACRTRDSLTLLRGMIDNLPRGETPTAVVFIASGLALPSRAAGGTGQSCEVTPDHYAGLSAAAAAARANLYVAQGDDAIASRDEGLENLAGVTNAGAVLRATGAGLARVLNETSAYYVATIAPDSNDRPGQTQRLEVRTAKEGVTIRARADVALGRSGAAGAGATGPVTPRAMISTTAAFTDLTLRATAVVSRGQAGKMTMLALAEPADPAVKLTALTAVLVDPATNKVAFMANADEKQLAARPIAIPMSSDPGKYRLRVAATDAQGRSGAVDHEVSADLTSAGSLKLGGLLLVAPRGTAFSPALVYSAEEEIGAYIEIYGQLTGQVSAKIEVAATNDGPALVTAQPGGQGTSEPDKFILNAKVPIGKLAPGDYVVRAIVQLEGQPEGKAFRTLRKVAK